MKAQSSIEFILFFAMAVIVVLLVGIVSLSVAQNAADTGINGVSAVDSLVTGNAAA